VKKVKPTLEESFWSKVAAGPNSCIIWVGARTGIDHDRGCFRRQPAYRVAYTLTKGPIPEGLVIDHLCNVGLCVNPYHLEAVTQAENLRRMSERAQAVGQYGIPCLVL
jgi:HNH endonuclease